MDDIVETVLASFLASLALAAISALAVIAYKHPKAYRYRRIMFVRSGLVPKDKVTTQLDAIQIPLWFLISNLAAFLYLFLLWTLPYWLLEKEPAQAQKEHKAHIEHHEE